MMELSLSSDQTNIASLLAGAGPLSVEEDLLAKYGSTAQETPVAPNSIIVFHPGSKYLRFGRASDAAPQTILHAIARRRKRRLNTNHQDEQDDVCNFNKQLQQQQQQTTERNNGEGLDDDKGHVHRDTLFPLQNSAKPAPEVELARLQLSHTLQTWLKSDGGFRFATPIEKIAEFNRSCKRIKIEDDFGERKSWKTYAEEVNTVFGDEVQELSPDSEFNIHFPWRRGQLHLHGGVGGSLSSVVSDLKDIWSWCITDKLEIPLKDLQGYRAVIILPAMFERNHANEIFNSVVNSLGFAYAFVIQDHVCASFGAGISCATVVDVGDQKISVSCVEDGTSFPQSRVELKYGCGDLNIALCNLMAQGAVPISLDLKCMWDMEFLSRLKERLCHLDLNRCGPELQKVVWDKPNGPPVKYNVNFGDELLIVPLSYFNPDLLRASISNNVVKVHRSQQSAPDDPFDAAYVTETSRRNLIEVEDGEEEDMEESREDSTSQSTNSEMITDKLLGIDQAILKSIESCSGEELKRRLYSCIVVVGGGFKFEGLGPWLQNKISLNIPRAFKSDPLEVITNPKEQDPAISVWKGAAILATLETATELWIAKLEWNSFGSRILRERSLFSF